MTIAVFHKLLAIFLTVALGYAAGRMRWLGSGTDASDPARVLGNAAFYIFVPALLFRTAARLDFATLPWGTVVAFFVPVLALLLAVYAWQRLSGAAARDGVAAPAVRAITVSFGNSVQLGIPIAAALFGEAGLAIHIALVSLHALVLLSVLTALVETDLARDQARRGEAAGLGPMLLTTLRNTVIHPVVLPIVAGLAWNLTGIGLHPVADETLQLMGSAVVPVCLVLIGLSLAYYGLQGRGRGAAGLSVIKLLVSPALVLAVAHWGFGLSGMALSVVVMMAALPVGSNALIFAQRYATLQSEATAAIVFSTVGFAATASLWLAVLAWLSG
jgi:predicted permease